MEVAEMYLDESQAGARFLSVAGYIFLKKNRLALEEKWAAILQVYDLPFFHMVDMAHGKPPFDKLSKLQREALQHELFDLLKKYLSTGYIASFDLSHRDLLPVGVDVHSGDRIGQITPYSFCCYFALIYAHQWAEKNAFQGQFAYFFEAGHRSQSQANRMIIDTMKSDALREFYRYTSHAFIQKRDSGAIQCADILAWQATKRINDNASGRDRPRADLKSLLQKPCEMILFNEEKIRQFLEIIKKHNSGYPP